MVRTVVKNSFYACQLSFDHCTIPAEICMILSNLKYAEYNYNNILLFFP